MLDFAPAPIAGRSHVLGYADVPVDDPWSIIVGHDGVFKVMLLALLDLPLARFWTLPFALCGITVVEIRDGLAAVGNRETLARLHLPEQLRKVCFGFVRSDFGLHGWCLHGRTNNADDRIKRGTETWQGFWPARNSVWPAVVSWLTDRR